MQGRRGKTGHMYADCSGRGSLTSPQVSNWLCGSRRASPAGNREARNARPCRTGAGTTAVIDTGPQLPGIGRLRAVGASARPARAGTH